MNKSLKTNYIYNLIYQMLVLVLPLITTPYLSRVLGADGVGVYSYTLSIVTYFILFGSLGIAMYGQREIAYIREDKEKTSYSFWEITILRIITMSISLLIFYFTFVKGTQYQIYYKILMLEMLANAIDISWFFQGLEEFKKTISRNIVVKIVSIICIFIFVKTKEHLNVYLLIYTLSNMLGNLTLWLYMPKYIEKIKIKSISLIKHLKPTIALFIPQIATQVYTVLDKTMIGNMLGDMNQVGNYEQSQKIIKMSLTIVTAFGTVVAPRIANTIANAQKEEVNKYLEKSFKFAWMIGIPIMFGIIAVSETLVEWFLGPGYEQSINLLRIGALLIMAIGLNNVSGIQYLIPAKKQNIYTTSVIAGAIFNFFANLILIKTLKAEGAIIASVLAEFLILFVQLYYVRKDINVKNVYKNTFKYLISGCIMFIVCFFIGRCMPKNMVTTMVQVISGITIYGICLIILKDEFVYNILSMLRTKLRRS